MRYLTLGLATARLSRFLTTDKLGDWLIVRPAKAWAVRHEGEGVEILEHSFLADGSPGRVEELPTGEPDEDNGWRSKLVAGLECPFCIGFWLGAGVLAADAALPERGVARGVFDLGTRALALNYVTAHINSRLDA